MQVLVNGEPREIESGATVAQLLERMELADRPLAIERNYEIVARAERARIVLEPGDRLEVVTLVGGG